jgi:hypothetical protein
MQFLSIGVNERNDDIIDQISDELKQLKSRKINYSIDEVSCEGSKSIICKIDEDNAVNKKQPHSFDFLRVHISNVLADYIIKQ